MLGLVRSSPLLIDGDTIKVLQDGRQMKIRLYGVDTLEKKQAFGQKAKDFTASFVAGRWWMLNRLIKTVTVGQLGS